VSGPRRVVVNADDLGRSAGINRGIVQAHERGIVTSASLMVRWPAAGEAAAYARAHAGLSVGLHLDLGEWVFRGGRWSVVYEVVSPGDGQAVAAEAERQLAAFQALLGRDPTHLDTHQHVHLEEPARSVAAALGLGLGVPVRHLDTRVRYCGDFYGQTGTGEPLPDRVTAAALVEALAAVEPGTTELACHPSLADDHGSLYAVERRLEVEALCDPRVRAAVSDTGIELRSFADPAVAGRSDEP